MDRRLLYLGKCIDNFKVVHYDPYKEGKVMFVPRLKLKITPVLKNAPG